jgi:C4-dicarboxylate transporter DctM subunit
MNLALLVIGCVMDNLAAMIILASFLIPIGEQRGMVPVQFEAIVAINFTISMAPPPVGYSIFVGAEREPGRKWLRRVISEVFDEIRT